MKLLTIVGARPQFVKVAPFEHALNLYNQRADVPIDSILVHTGQHYDDEMSRVFFAQLKIATPKHNLGVGSGLHGRQTAEMISRAEEILIEEEPSIVILYGDTNSTLAGAVAAAKLHIPIAHIEAGLRSFNRRMPEETNRVLTDHVSDLLFAPTDTAANNLRAEGIKSGVHVVGDVMYDAVMQHLPFATSASTILERLQVKSREYCLVTLHRAENTDDPSRLRAICEALEQVSHHHTLVWPLHPRSWKRLRELHLRCDSEAIRLTDPVSYYDMLMLEQNARAIVTDSGGVQKEAHWLQVPCVTLRSETEWIETLQCGCNQLGGLSVAEMTRTILNACTRSACGFASGSEISGAATRIVNVVANFCGTHFSEDACQVSETRALQV